MLDIELGAACSADLSPPVLSLNMRKFQVLGKTYVRQLGRPLSACRVACCFVVEHAALL